VLPNRALWHGIRAPEGWDVAGHSLLGGEKKESRGWEGNVVSKGIHFKGLKESMV